jgi:hypothetical protein
MGVGGGAMWAADTEGVVGEAHAAGEQAGNDLVKSRSDI